MIYTSAIDEITWKAVEDFCGQGVVEGAYLDYKVDFPNDLARTIAAMANTFGGIILIGVDEQVDGRPVVQAPNAPAKSHLPCKTSPATTLILDINPPVAA